VEDNLQEQSFDVEAASDDLAGSLFDSQPKESESEDFVDTAVDLAASEETEPVVEEVVEEAPVRAAPKTWPKEMHEHWAKTPPEVQQYWETREKQMLDGLDQYKGEANFGKEMRDVLTPYMARITAAGTNPAGAVKALLNADHVLSSGSPSEKVAFFKHLAKEYRIDLGQSGGDEQQNSDPLIRQLQDELHQVKQSIASGNEVMMNQEKAKVVNLVNEFAADPKHIYFDEVADDIIAMLKTGASLEDAYEKAVWANPSTRQKELARVQTEQQEALKKSAIEKANAAKAAKAVNLNGRDTQRTPTEGKRATLRDLDSVMRESMAEIKQSH